MISLMPKSPFLSRPSPFISVSGGRKGCIVTNGGGWGVLAADECVKKMLDVAEVPDEKKGKLRETFRLFMLQTIR